MCDLCKFAVSLSFYHFPFFLFALRFAPSPQCLTLKWHRNQTISRREIKVLLCPLALVNMATMFENVAFIIQVLTLSLSLSLVALCLFFDFQFNSCISFYFMILSQSTKKMFITVHSLCVVHVFI